MRSVFRYVYFMFLALASVALALLSLWFFQSGAAAALARSLPDMETPAITVPMMAALAMGLCVPLFFAGWLVLSAAIFGPLTAPRPFMDGVRD